MTKFITLTTQSQISIPSLFRQQLGLEKGDMLKAEIVGNALVLRPAGDIMALGGSLSRVAKKGISAQAIRKREAKAIEESVVQRYLSSLPS